VTPALPGLFDELLATEPGLPALVQDGHTTTFGGWWADSSLIASGLAGLGTGRRDMVVLMLASGQDFASCYLAALRLGAIVSAINPRLGATETEHIIAQCEPAVIITDAPDRVPEMARCPVVTPAAARGPALTVTGWAATSADEPAVVVWTTAALHIV
jgi:acyl-coenzyme A synthetase/AMP-(fatty) acid ligase